MAGHSKWANTKHKKARNDAARQKLWGKLAKEITVAAKLGGGDLEMNPRLRAAVLKAKSNSMPNKNIDSAIATGVGGNQGDNVEELLYEGYGPGGTAFIVTALTDNKTRTVANVRNIFSKSGGSMGETGSVAWGFNFIGHFVVARDQADEDELMELVLEAGADDFDASEEVYEITSSFENFSAVAKALDDAKIPMLNAETTYMAENVVDVDQAMAEKVNNLVEKFEDNDDVQDVYHNAKFPE